MKKSLLSKISIYTIVFGWLSIYISFVLLSAGVKVGLYLALVVPTICSLIGMIFSFKANKTRLIFLLNLLTLLLIYLSMGVVMTLVESINI